MEEGYEYSSPKRAKANKNIDMLLTQAKILTNQTNEINLANPEQLASFFKNLNEIEKEIIQFIQGELEQVHITEDKEEGLLSHFKEAIEVLGKCGIFFKEQTQVFSLIAGAYLNLSEDQKVLFMNGFFSTKDKAIQAINNYEAFIARLDFDAAKAYPLLCQSDLLKLIITPPGFMQICNINSLLSQSPYKGKFIERIEVAFNSANATTMTYTPRHLAQNVKFNKEYFDKINNDYEKDVLAYEKQIMDEGSLQKSTIPNLEKKHELKYRHPDASHKIAVKVGIINGKACLSVGPSIASLYHELCHMQRALLEKLCKEIPVTVQFNLLHTNLEEYYTTKMEKVILDFLNIPERITHRGTPVATNKLKNGNYLADLLGNFSFF